MPSRKDNMQIREASGGISTVDLTAETTKML